VRLVEIGGGHYRVCLQIPDGWDCFIYQGVRYELSDGRFYGHRLDTP
jgi:hypothetical protein